MTHGPRFPTVEEVMARNPYEVIDTPWGEMPAWRADAMAVGTIGALCHVFDMVRADSAAAMARADADQARVALLKDVLTKLDALSARCDAQAAELATFKAKERADAAAEEERLRALEEDPLEDPPDIAEYQARNPPAKIGDDTHQPGGELHDLPPKEDPDLEVGADQGNLPNELQEGVPPAPGNYPTLELPKPPVVSQPISVSLNQE